MLRYEKKELLPLLVSKNDNFDFDMDLLLLTDGTVHHYVLILDLLKLVCKIRGNQHRDRNELCRNCFHVCSSLQMLRVHQESCYNQSAAVINMPKVDQSRLTFDKLAARAMLPYVIYFDLESLLVPVQTVKNSHGSSSTTLLEQHLPCSFCAVVVERGSSSPSLVKLERGEDVMKTFLEFLERFARDVYERKRKNEVYSGPTPVGKELAHSCWICDQPFENNENKILDHCHWSGEFLGWAHNVCNVNRKTENFTPVFAHNMQNYDLHHIIKALNTSSRSNVFSVVPSTDEKYIALNMGVLVKTITDKNGRTRNVYEYLRFVDSYKFMLMPLDKLAVNLPGDKFVFLDSYFSNYTTEQRNLLKKKGHFPYSYLDSFQKFDVKGLPPLKLWRNSLSNNEISITREEYNHAKRVYNEFRCKNFGDYHDLYLACDALILASAFENFRGVCYQTYGLDCSQFYTASNLTGSAFLKVCKPELDLLTDREMLDLTEDMIRGGVASVYSKRMVKANNKYMADYNPREPSSYIICIDANNLYGGIMEKFMLPLNQFEWASGVTIETILATSDNSEVGYIVEVDLEYPDHLHDIHSDFPLAPVKQSINTAWLSEYQRNVLGERPVNSKSKKLIQTLYRKERYTLHYITLKLYISLGLQVSKVHRVLTFKQSKWLQPYMKLNTKKRKEATSKCDQDFFKLMSNSTYGKLCESKRNRVNVKLVRTEKDLLHETQKQQLASVKIIDENLVVVAKKPSKILWNKPTLVGAVVLDLAKYFMYNFHYNVMKKFFNCQLLYSDTDSLFYEVKCDDFYEDLATNSSVKREFDFSNFDPSHKLHSRENERETLKFKDEMGGHIVEEYCGLKPKLYSLKTSG